MTHVIKKSRIALLAIVFLILVLLLSFIMPLKIYADTYDVGDTGPGGGTVFLALPCGLCKEAIAYDPDHKYDWYEAVSNCEGANIGGYDDWYLPDSGELYKVYTELYDQPLGSSIDNRCYWSSDEIEGNSDEAYFLLFYSGAVFLTTPISKSIDNYSISFGGVVIDGIYIIAVRSFIGDPKSTCGGGAVESEEVWVRTQEMTCKQVWINEDNKFQFSFIYPYKDNNWVKIYDMSGKEVYSIDMPYANPNIIVDLPDGIYTVKTFNDQPEPIQEFVIGKP